MATEQTPTALRRALAQQLAAARALSDSLFELATPSGLFERPIAERHRFIFYLGHLEVFDWNLICHEALGAASRNAHFERLFALGIDPDSDSLPADTAADWPSPQVIGQWNAENRAAVDEALATAPLSGWLHEGWGIRMTIEHRLMHAETLTYMLMRLDPRFKVTGPIPSVVAGRSAPTAAVHVPRGTVTMGLSRRDAPHAGWDNEYERHAVDVPAFSVSKLPISNGDWLSFVEAGGYRERALWAAADWAWRERENISHPAFWRMREGRWQWVAMFGEVPLPTHWPVYVSHAEATAYARWRNARLPTEAEWQRCASTITPGAQGNFGFARFDPVESGSSPSGDTDLGLSDLAGNGWEWTSTVFEAFAGFEPMPFYLGYSANFFDGNHFVLKGASAATDATFLRPSFRNWFQPHYQHVFAKFRLVNEGGVS